MHFFLFTSPEACQADLRKAKRSAGAFAAAALAGQRKGKLSLRGVRSTALSLGTPCWLAAQRSQKENQEPLGVYFDTHWAMFVVIERSRCEWSVWRVNRIPSSIRRKRGALSHAQRGIACLTVAHVRVCVKRGDASWVGHTYIQQQTFRMTTNGMGGLVFPWHL